MPTDFYDIGAEDLEPLPKEETEETCCEDLDADLEYHPVPVWDMPPVDPELEGLPIQEQIDRICEEFD